MSAEAIENGRRIRVCVCTSLEAVQEPRAPRHASALASLGSELEVVFVDCAPVGAVRRRVKALEGFHNLDWRTHFFLSRADNPLKLAVGRIRQRLAQVVFRCGGPALAEGLSTRALGLERLLKDVAADIYLAHNIETFLPAHRAAQGRGALIMFDSMEFHSDMGENQSAVERELVRAVETSCLPGCALVLASSAHVADALAAEYGIARPLPLDNTPLIEKVLPDKPKSGFHLYWRNSTVGLSQRGLDDALVALTKLPHDVTLHLQGRLPANGGAVLQLRIAELRLTDRVIFHAPYAPEEAVKEAARHHVGLCLERRGVRNHDLTVSNKVFDYQMAGLAVIASDLPGMRCVIERSDGGILFTPGSADDLTSKILSLYHNRALLDKIATCGRAFALLEANRETEMKKFVKAFVNVCRERLGVAFAH